VVLRIDMVAILVPATWVVPGAGPVPTTRNKDFVEGRLEPVPIDVSELATAGMKLPGSLFEAEGTNGRGGHIGVRVGIYDTGGPNPLSLVQDAADRLTPNASVDPTQLITGRGLRTLQRWDDEQINGGAVICDYWAGIKSGVGKEPTSFVLIRLWRTGPASPGEEELFDDVAGSFLIGGGASFSGPLRLTTVRTSEPPPEGEVAEPNRFRYAGWRLGQVYHSKMISAEQAELLTEGSARPRDGLLLLGVFLVWLIAIVAFVGVGSELLLGGATMAGTLPQLRKHGLKAVLTMAVVLAALLALGVATS
jgi:hypothetical protein